MSCGRMTTYTMSEQKYHSPYTVLTVVASTMPRTPTTTTIARSTHTNSPSHACIAICKKENTFLKCIKYRSMFFGFFFNC